MDTNMMINYKLSSPDLITYPDILHLLTDQDVRCYPLIQLLVDVSRVIEHSVCLILRAHTDQPRPESFTL